MSGTTTWRLSGLDGGNPLAFLAALGLLNCVSALWGAANPRMAWDIEDGAWHPWLTIDGEQTDGALVEGLVEHMQALAQSPALTFADDLSVSGERFREVAEHVYRQSSPADRCASDLIAGFACDALVDEKGQNIFDTALRTMQGAGHQHFLGFMRTLLSSTETRHVRSALFQPWAYSDPGPSMRWDPTDDRRYALRWGEPSGDPIRTVRGANALGVLGLPMLPTQPDGGRLGTTGFRQIPRQGTFWTWPIWTCPLPIDVVRSMLALQELQTDRPPRDRLLARGVADVFRTQRISQGKYRNFTVASPV